MPQFFNQSRRYGQASLAESALDCGVLTPHEHPAFVRVPAPRLRLLLFSPSMACLSLLLQLKDHLNVSEANYCFLPMLMLTITSGLGNK
jgi:hypothetical protein